MTKAKAPLMPKATAVWLIENTALTFEQIGDFCHLHSLEVKALADEEGARIVGQSPITSGELTQDEIDRCEKDPKGILVMRKSDLPQPKQRSKGPRYTPVSKRGDKPDAIAFLLKTYPELKDAQIVKLIGTTKNTINNIRERTHADIANIKPRNPVDLGLCTYVEMEAALEKARKNMPKDAIPKPAVDVTEQDNAVDDAKMSEFSSFLGTGTSGQGE